MNSEVKKLLADGFYAEALKLLRGSDPWGEALCLEALGLPHSEALRKALAAGFPEDLGWRDQAAALRIRVGLAEKEALEKLRVEGPESEYEAAWTFSLPILKKGFRASQDGLESPYQLNTLLGRGSSQEGSPGSQAFAERLYLWCWQWMSAPQLILAPDPVGMLTDVQAQGKCGDGLGFKCTL